MAANVEKIVDDLSALTVIEAADLAKRLEEKMGRFRRCRSCGCRSGCRCWSSC